MMQESVEEKQLEQLLSHFGSKGFNTRCKGIPINSNNIQVLVAMSYFEEKVTRPQIEKKSGKTKSIVLKALYKWVKLGTVHHERGSPKYTLDDGMRKKIRDYRSNEQTDPNDLLKNLGVEILTKPPKIDIEHERYSRFRKLNLNEKEFQTIIAVNGGIDRPISITYSTGLPMGTVEHSLYSLLGKGLIIRVRKGGSYILSTIVKRFIKGEIDVETLRINLKVAIEKVLNFSEIENKQYQKLLALPFDQLNVVLILTNIRTIVFGSKWSKPFSRVKLQRMLNISYMQSKKTLTKLVKSGHVIKQKQGLYAIRSETKTITIDFLSNGEYSAEKFLVAVKGIKLRELELRTLLAILGRQGPRKIGRVLGVYNNSIFRIIKRLKVIRFIDQRKSHTPHYLTEIAGEYLKQLLESEPDIALSTQEIELIRSKLANGLQNERIEIKKEIEAKKKGRKKLKTARRPRTVGTKKRTSREPMTEQERLLRKFSRLERKLTNGDWNLLQLIDDHHSLGVNFPVVSLPDISTPEVNGFVPNPQGSIKTLRLERLIETRSMRGREYRLTGQGVSILELRNNGGTKH